MGPKVDLKRSMTSHKNWVNDAIQRAVKFMGNNPDGLCTPGDQKVAERLVEKMEENIASMKSKWTDVFLPQLEKEDPNNLFDEWDEKVLDTSKEAENQIDVLRAAIKAFVTKESAPNSAPVANSKTPKMNTAFKPSTLLASNNLQEFYAWERSFLGYYEQNQEFLATTTPQLRQLFVTDLLDSKLQSALVTDTTLTMDTPIKGINENDENSILSWIKNHILRHKPLHIRRYEYSNCKQNPKESFGDWWTRKLMKAKECDLEKVTVESIQITELICGIVDERLREEILRIKDPTLETLVALGKRFDTSAKVQKENFGMEVQVNKVSEYRKAKNQKNDPVKENSSTENPKSGNRDEGKYCKHCGYWDCPKKPCKFSDRFCSMCGKKGHSSKVCSKRTENADNVSANIVRVSSVSIKPKTKSPKMAKTKEESAMEAGTASKNNQILKEEDYKCFVHSIRCYYPWKCPHAVTKEFLLNSEVSEIANVVGETEYFVGLTKEKVAKEQAGKFSDSVGGGEDGDTRDDILADIRRVRTGKNIEIRRSKRLKEKVNS